MRSEMIRLIILRGNKLCARFRSKNQQKDIRAQMRYLDRFLIEIKNEDSSIQELANVFDTTQYDNVRKAINVTAGLNEETGLYKAPATASILGGILKQCGRHFISECTKSQTRKREDGLSNYLNTFWTTFLQMLAAPLGRAN